MDASIHLVFFNLTHQGAANKFLGLVHGNNLFALGTFGLLKLYFFLALLYCDQSLKSIRLETGHVELVETLSAEEHVHLACLFLLISDGRETIATHGLMELVLWFMVGTHYFVLALLNLLRFLLLYYLLRLLRLCTIASRATEDIAATLILSCECFCICVGGLG